MPVHASPNVDRILKLVNMENVIYDRLAQIAQTDLKISLLRFKNNDKLFVDIVKKVCAFPEIADISEDARTRKEKEKNVTIALKVLDMVTVDLNNIKAKHVLDANFKLNRLLKDLFFYYTDRKIRSYRMDTEDSTIENFRQWINKILHPDHGISNFTSDWINPMTFGALLDKTKPGLCPEWQNLSSALELEITTDLMRKAERYLDIKQIIKPEVMISGRENDISVMIYLSQFLELKVDLMPIFVQDCAKQATAGGYSPNYKQAHISDKNDYLQYQKLQGYREPNLHPIQANYKASATNIQQNVYSDMSERKTLPVMPVLPAAIVKETPDQGRPSTIQEPGMMGRRDSGDSYQETVVFKRESNPAVKYDTNYAEKNLGKVIFNKPQNEQEFWEQAKDCGIKYRQELKESVEKGVLDLGLRLGAGHFGEVFKCSFAAGDELQICALKTIKLDKTGTMPSAKVVKDFIEEAWIAKCCDHKNVIRLLHFIFHDGLPCLMFPFYNNGDLKSYLKKNKPDEDKLTPFSIDVTNGLKYLIGCGYIHRDLAARNCLVTDEETVVLADFGLSRDVLNDIYTMHDNTPIPWRRLAPEVLSAPQKVFSKATDVWSLGVLLWEIFSHGKMPFKTIRNEESLFKFLQCGKRLDRPPFGSDAIYGIMLRCWDKNPLNRASFDEILDTLMSSHVYEELCSG